MDEQVERQVWSAPKCVELTTRRTLGGTEPYAFEAQGNTTCYPTTTPGS